MASQQVLWFFDLDDTLFWNERCFSRAFVVFHEFLASRALPDRSLPFISQIVDKVEEFSVALLEEINPCTGRPFGVSIERFPEALVRCYQWLCDRVHADVDETVSSQIREIGMLAFDPNYFEKLGLAPGVIETLDALQAGGDALVLLTRGDSRSQEQKVSALGLSKWFGKENVYMVAQKTPAVFKEIASRFPDCVVVSVGNAYKYDIAPALEAGFFGIYIPAESWSGEANDLPISETDKLMEVHEIAHVLEFRDKIIGLA